MNDWLLFDDLLGAKIKIVLTIHSKIEQASTFIEDLFYTTHS